MAEVQRKLVHKQFNSPMGLYSQQNVKETLNRELQAFGSQGIEIDEARPLNLANSAVLRAVAEEEEMKCEPLVKAERQSRARQRFYQRPHTPVHQHQLEQIKTQYLSHQHDITIDRDTVLKINRLATRRNLHKREHSWPPTTMAAVAAADASVTTNNEQLKNIDRTGKMLNEQHVRSSSNDNALQFDETVCKRHGIDVMRKKFNSPTRIIEPTAQEVRQMREQQRKLRTQHQQQQQQCRSRSDNGGRGGDDDCRYVHDVSKNKPKQMINLVKHEELLRKNSTNKSATMTGTTNVLRTNDYVEFERNSRNISLVSIPGQQTSVKSNEMESNKNLAAKELMENELFKNTNVPKAKGFSHPETKAADEDIGLVEPKRQFYEQLDSCKKWHSYENLNAAANAKPAIAKPLLTQTHKRQAYSLERGREARQHTQLPPQKPRFSPKLQRRSTKLATEIKISYDADANQHNIQVKSLNQPKKNQPMTPAPTATTTLDDLEHIPLPATPNNNRSVPVSVEESGKQQCELNTDTKTKSLKDQQIYDDSCIYLRSVDLQDNTVAYIPAAITIVPSPTEEIMQHWMESSNLKANIKGVNDTETADNTATKTPHDVQEKTENLISMLKYESVKSTATPEGIKYQHRYKQQRNDMQDAAVETKAETDTYVTRLPSTPNGIQLTRQASVNTKRKTQMNNNNDNITNNKTQSTLAMTSEAATHESLKQNTSAPGVIHSNAASSECNKVARESDKIQQQGIYYTDGEYVFGPYDPSNGTPHANAIVRSLQAEQQQKQQQLHQQPQIKKDIEAETKSQHKNEIANLTAKYEHIQKSINEHLRQIDAYIENAKAALKSTIATGNKPESSSTSPIQADQQQSSQPQSQHSHNHGPPQCNLKAQMQQQPQTETPLKEILRKITNIMQEVKPIHRNQKAKQEICMQHEHTTAAIQDGEENMPIVDKVLMELNMLTKRLSEFDTSSSEELKPIIKQLQQTPLDLQFETRPSVATASHVFITEETSTSKQNLLDTAKSHTLKEAYTSETAKSTQTTPTPPPPPPPPLPPAPVALTKPKQEKRKEHIEDEQLLATDKLITAAQIQSQQHTQQSPIQKQQKEMTMSAVTSKDKDATTASAKDKTKNFVFDFITARHEQEQFVEQVIDTLGKLENESKENLVNIHVPAHDEKIKSNLNQQTQPSSAEASTSTASTKNEKDVAIMQNCNISVLANASSKDACNHDNDPKSTKCNESLLKLHIKDFADKIADKQFQKYDNQPTKNTNDVVNTSNNNKPGQRQLTHEHNKHVSCHDDEDDKGDGIKKLMDQQQQEEDGGSNRSSGSELSNTYKSSYELPSPYVTVRQISWEDVQATAPQTSAKRTEVASSVLTSSVNIVKPKHDIQIAQICSKSPVTLYEFETTTSTLASTPVTTSGHVEMQSTTALKPRIQTRKQPQPEQRHKQQIPHQTPTTLDEGRKYPAHLIEPHLPTRSTSPFGLNAIELPFKQRSPSVSPTRLRKIRIAQDASATRKYPSPLVELHLPTRATSPFGLNAVEMKNVKRSPSTSPKRAAKYNVLRTSPRTVDEMAIRKYPAPLVEPHVPTRAASPFGINAVDVLHTIRARTPLPTYGLEVKSDDEHEQEYYDDDDDEHKDKPTSPIRKYPPALIEPHVPTRAASPFGLNAVETKQKARHRTPSPACGHHPHQAPTLKSSSTAIDSCNKTVAYVPQVEGHNIGLLVRTSTPIPYYHAVDATTHASSRHSEISATKTPYDYATMTARDITGNNDCAKNDIGRDAANNNDNDYVDEDDDEATCDELQRINTIGSTKQVKQPKMRNLNTAGTTAVAAPATTNKTMAHHQPQQQELQQQQQHHEPEPAHLQQQEQYSDGGGSSSQHMAVDIIPLPTSVINRSFNNVSPRPYISIEGYKRVAWPPASEERIVREFTPQPQTQYPPVPAYNQQQQQHQPTAAATTAVPPTQGPIYNNVQHQAPISNTNNFARENNSSYKQTPTQNQNENDYEAFPPQTPETPIILKDKQFSRLPSHEPNPINSVPYQHQQQQYQQPQNQKQEHHHQAQSQYQQPLYNNQQQNYQQHQYPPQQQNVSYTQQQQQPQYQEDTCHQHNPSGWKPISPPQTKPDTLFTGNYGVGTTAPTNIYQQQYQNYQQPPTNQQQQYRAPSHDNYQQPQQHQQQYQQTPQYLPQQQQQFAPQPQYQAPAAAQNQYQQQPQAGSQYQQPPQQQYQQQQPACAQQQQPHQQQYQQPPWVQQPQQQQQPQQYQQPQYQNPLNQYNQASHLQQKQQQPQQYPPQQNQFVPQTNQQQFNSYSQPQQQQHTVSHDQVDQQHYQPQVTQDLRGASPGIITLRKEAPITQKPAPVYSSQPAAISYRGGSSMRGDLKWPPPEYKEAAAKENEERRKLALGPVCRPRKINRDYTPFFAKNALSHHYPSYKVPPGTQHMTY